MKVIQLLVQLCLISVTLAFSSESINTPFIRKAPADATVAEEDNNDVPGRNSSSSQHNIMGISCREVDNELPIVGTITVLEATADSQEILVDECLELEEGKYEKRISEGDPYGAVLWPASWAVSNYVLSQEDIMKNISSLSVLELGAGSGLVSISIAAAGAKRVLATDYEPLALALTRYAAESMNNNNKIDQGCNVGSSNNIKSNSISSRIETQLLDMCDTKQKYLPLREKKIDIVLAADVLYEPKTGKALAHRVVEALRHNCRVIVGDSPGRPGRPEFLNTLKSLGVEGAAFQEMVGFTCLGPRHELICGKGSTSVSEQTTELPIAILDLKPVDLMLQR